MNAPRLLDVLQMPEAPPAARVQHADRPRARHRLEKQFEALGIELRGEHVHAGDVAAGPRETRHEAGFQQTCCPQNRMTTGMVAVACLAATMAGGLTATMMSTFARTSSAASAGSRRRSSWAERTSNVTV